MFISERQLTNVLVIGAVVFSLSTIFLRGFSESNLFWFCTIIFMLGLSFVFLYEWWKKKTVVQICSAIVSEIVSVSSDEKFYYRLDAMKNNLPNIIVRRIPEPELFDFKPYNCTIASVVTRGGGHIILVSGHVLNLLHDKEALTFILAHEVAHLYLGHAEHVKNRYPNGILFSRDEETATLERQTLRDMELDADQWAVEVVQFMGISLDSIHRAFSFVERERYDLSEVVDLDYYPSIKDRIEKINQKVTRDTAPLNVLFGGWSALLHNYSDPVDPAMRLSPR